MQPADIKTEITSYFARNIKWLIAIVLALALVDRAYYTVDPTEMAGVRRLNTVVSQQPVGEGLHFKIPFLDRVDKVPVSLETYTVPPVGREYDRQSAGAAGGRRHLQNARERRPAPAL